MASKNFKVREVIIVAQRSLFATSFEELDHTCSWGPRPGGLDLLGRGVGTIILSCRPLGGRGPVYPVQIRHNRPRGGRGGTCS